MFDIEDFKENPTLEPIILKFNKFYSKNKLVKISKIIDELNDLIDNEELIVPITYILSIIAENNINLISDNSLKKIEPFIHSDNDKLKTNAILIIGFKMLSKSEYIKEYLPIFMKLLTDDSRDIRDNGHFFLGEIVKKNPNELCNHKDIVLKAFKIEKNEENISSLLGILSSYKDLSFKQLYQLREILRELIIKYPREKNESILSSIINLINVFFPSLKDIDKKSLKDIKLIELLEKHFLMKVHNFTAISKKQGISLDDFTNLIKKNYIKDKEFYFYIKNRKTNTILFFELEHDKLINFFDREEKISFEEISIKFSPIIENKSDMKIFINVLIKLGKIDGFYSKLGLFYPFLYLKTTIKNELKKNGIVNLKNYDFLPPKFIEKIIDQLSVETNQIFLLGKNDKVYYSLKKIQVQVNSEAAKNSSIDLNPFRNRLKDEEFIVLIKNLPKEYLTNLRKGTHWLTNIGKTKIRNEIENSKIIGFFNLSRISEKLNVKKILLMDVLEQSIDLRSGIWDKNKEMFYYSKFLKQKIEGINQISEEEEKTIKINSLASELNIDKNIILTKIDENLLLIGNEIKKQDQIIISDYLEKLGMDNEMFINFIHDLGLNYFIKGNTLILNSAKIEDAKKDIRTMLIEKSKSVDFINFGNFDINSELVHSLIKELESDEKIKGIFYEEESEIVFYTKNGIKNMMLNSSLLFSFYDFFYGKDLNDQEISLMKEIFNDLINSRKLKGIFDEKTLTFSSEEILFAKDYNAIVDDFNKMVNLYVKRFDKEFQVIKKTLSKHDEIIYPQEIKVIQEIIDRINLNYIKWRAQINSFMRSTNNKILKEQGFTQKRYEGLSEDKKAEIKLFKEDPDVNDIVERFNSWVDFFNELELSYGKIIFLQKKRINNPDDTESEDKLDELLRNLSIIK